MKLEGGWASVVLVKSVDINPIVGGFFLVSRGWRGVRA